MHNKCVLHGWPWRCIVSVVRLNVTLPDDLARKLDEIVKPKEKSHFIAVGNSLKGTKYSTVVPA